MIESLELRTSTILVFMKFIVNKIKIKIKDGQEFTYTFLTLKKIRGSKKFLLSLLATLKHNYAKAMIQKSHQNRKEEDVLEKSEAIQITHQLIIKIKDQSLTQVR